MFEFFFLFIALLTFQVLIISIQYAYVKRTEFVYYISYLLLVGAYVGGKLLFLDNIYHFKINFLLLFDKPTVILSTMFYYIFSRQLMDIKTNHDAIYKQLLIVEKLLLAYGIIEFFILVFFGPSMPEEYIFRVFYFSIFCYSCYFMYSVYKVNVSPFFIFITIGSFFVFLGTLGTFLLFEIYFAGNSSIAKYVLLPFEVAVSIEMVVFNTALGYKTYLNEKEKIKIEQQYISELKQKNAIQQNLLQLKQKISSDLHDDVGSTLGNISLIADLSLNNEEKKAHENLKHIVRLSNQGIEDIRTMLWVLNPAKDKWFDLFDKIIGDFKPLLENLNIKFTTSIHENFETLNVTILTKRNTILILKEALHNIVKHAKCTKVSLTAFIENDVITIKLKDNGIGFDKTKNADGNGLTNILYRAHEIDANIDLKSDAENGTIYSILLTNKI